MKKNCTCCGRHAIIYSHFKCPDCGDEEIIRCQNCRKKVVEYVCGKCGFVGP
ncbi:MAG: zinc finger domain-containing protein [Candidatus Micrarchaeota archaeon]|nr:zinc finger domain-containing protein [Candidatus Micrarchaeota archaeon]